MGYGTKGSGSEASCRLMASLFGFRKGFKEGPEPSRKRNHKGAYGLSGRSRLRQRQTPKERCPMRIEPLYEEFLTYLSV